MARTAAKESYWREKELEADNARLRELLRGCRVHFEAILINTHNETAVANGCRDALATLTAELEPEQG